MGKQIRWKRHLSAVQIIALSFLGAIMAGTVLLMLPISSRSAQVTSFADAIFTATSSVCVTGLVVHDTVTYWSWFGQGVILLLIQTGGMGIVTVAVLVVMASGRKIGLMQRSTMQEAIAAPNMKGIVRLTYFILKVTAASELLGAALMAPVFCGRFGLGKGIWYALFHSVSAFCNAGFDLMGEGGAYSSLTGFTGQPVVNFVIMALIIWGGIGFLTWEDIWTYRWNLRRYRMQSKVILLTTLVLIVVPALYFYFIEFSRGAWGTMTQQERVLASLFQAVTTRTAGFNTVDLSNMTDTSQFLFILLMIIGGSPGSTAGGMKTTTIAVLIASAIAVFLHKQDAHFFGRRVSGQTLRYAAAIFVMYMVLLFGGGILLSVLENLPIVPCLFEAASGIGTVGLSLGLTPGLRLASRMILVCLMYMGRVGGLTLVFAATSNFRPTPSKYPQEKITVG